MKIRINGKYMTFPVNARAAAKKVCLSDGGKLLFDFDCRIDLLHPDFTAYIDVSAFCGRAVELSIEPDLPYTPAFADEPDLPGLWNEPLRPEVHFTVKNGWNNDPNGLVFVDGVYHMFYQYNPAAPVWGNMHWGHATSSDLLHWEEEDIALFPDENGTVFSGSALTDTENASGLGRGTMLLFYTGAGGSNRLSKGKPFTQCLAYSRDGVTFHKYGKNPIVPHIEAANRDPKVVYVPEIGKYSMAIYRAEWRYELLISTDLLHWEEFALLPLRDDAECPDLFRLPCGEKFYYVFMGARDVYIVGHFEKDRFVIDQSEKKLTHLKMSYAAQSFSGLPGGRVVRIAWHILNAPGGRFASQMSFPTEMRLEKQDGEFRLSAAPIREIESLYTRGETLRDRALCAPLTVETGAAALDLSLSLAYTHGQILKIDLFGTDLVCDMEKNEIRCKNLKMPLSPDGERVEVRVLVDRCSLEIFAGRGRIFAAVAAFADYNLPRVTLGKNEKIRIDRLTWHTLKNIHKGE
ncbi:MAG: glycoside hydrolase family 32 protein [Clostridia bacterium]|nr:glycoside hydrolase family 32 protein [Clostridia bacterium]